MPYFDFENTARFFVLRLTRDWKDAPGPLPVIVVLHDDYQRAAEAAAIIGIHRIADAADPVTDATKWDDKFITVYIQAMDFGPAPLETSVGGQWNAGHNDGEPGAAQPDDVGLVYDLLERLNARMLPEFQAYKAALGEPEPTTVFDPLRIYLLGYGMGGTLAYWVLKESPRNGIEIAACCVVNGTIGGYAYAKHAPGGVAPDITKRIVHAPNALSSIDCSLLHIHGELDFEVNALEPLGLNGSRSTARDSVFTDAPPDGLDLSAQWVEDYQRWDMGMNIGLALWAHHLGSAGPPPWVRVAVVNPNPSIPALGTNTDRTVEGLLIVGGTHLWPERIDPFDPTSQLTRELIWDFFKANARA